MKKLKLSKEMEIDWRNIIQYLPTGFKVRTDVGVDYIKIFILLTISAPPMTTESPKKISIDLKEFLDNFERDVKKYVGIIFSKQDIYTQMIAKSGEIIFERGIIFKVKNKDEMEKLKELDKYLEKYKK
jgi:hypothetical protein